jgi:hypothetical protein
MKSTVKASLSPAMHPCPDAVRASTREPRGPEIGRHPGEDDPAIAASIAVVHGLRTTDADRRSFTTFTKRTGRQAMLAAGWPGQGHFL